MKDDKGVLLMRRNGKGKRSKIRWNKILVLFSILFILISCVILYVCIKRSNDENNDGKEIANEVDLSLIRDGYHDYVTLNDGSSLYLKEDNTYKKISTVRGSVELALDSTYSIVDEYFKVLDSDYYVKYDEVSGIEALSPLSGEYKYYQNYVVYNENVELKDKAKLYVDDVNYYEVDGGSYPIIVKDSDRYGIEFNHHLVYVSASDVSSVIESQNTDMEHTDGLSVLNYHYVVSSSNENGELDECQQSICITDTMFDSHVKYLKDNGYYGASMRDLELFIDGKVQLPKNSVVITFDDGWYVSRSIMVLEKYQMLGTLFLIGSLASPTAYVSPYLEVHSHSWDMHKIGDCPSSVGRGGILCLDENTVLEDLKKSRESLNNTTYFCYPFYDYNERAIELLKQAGFTMAFAGELKDSTVRVGQDKFRIPRYVIINSTTMNQFIQYVS